MNAKPVSPTPSGQAPAVPVTPSVAIDWREVARAALGSALFAGLLGGMAYVLMNARADGAHPATRRESEEEAPSVEEDAATDEGDADDVEPQPGFVDRETAKQVIEEVMAASLLGVDLDASDAEIRAALRARLTESRSHPDHGGDGDQAARLIAARDLLIERARRAQP